MRNYSEFPQSGRPLNVGASRIVPSRTVYTYQVLGTRAGRAQDLMRIPVKSTSDSGSSRPPVLIQVDRRFRFHPASAVALRGWSEVAMAGQR